ncbi:PREDICTED: probable [Prunus dulcis]|uniref:PREDICTED: probable n=1 Tax=Prunus dulcis TaxID=3755 RepID=A0A5E4EN36_PRUDU|nr:PREDICTED: probable [Prunus dulcis]
MATLLKGLYRLPLATSRLTILDLGNNFFTQEIPAEISELTELEYLSLYNSFHGTIPHQLSNLRKISAAIHSQEQYLQAWHLDLNMLSLNSYDFSYNNLTGPIPTCGIFQKAPPNAFIGNSGMICWCIGVAAVMELE